MNGKLNPFARAKLIRHESMAEFITRQVVRGFKPEIAARLWEEMELHEIWKNNEYQVSIDKHTPHGFGENVVVWHLSIKRLDKKPIHDWRDLQAIKSMLVSPDAEAIELYPAESRVMDGANQFHLYAFTRGADGQSFPMILLGSTDPRAVTSDPQEPGAKQRKLATFKWRQRLNSSEPRSEPEQSSEPGALREP